jgi:hemoglobin/transferrin/lactoferrin receptor protein
MHNNFKSILCAAGLLFITPAYYVSMAQEQEKAKTLPHFEETVIVTATRTESNLNMISKSITVIDHETIASHNIIGILNLLEGYVPGIAISKSGAIGGQVTLRGLSSNDLKVPLFIDGDRFRGRLQLEYLYLDPDRIERIEIIRGPAAAMYGTDAMGGLINIITRKAKGERKAGFSLTPRLRSLEYSSAGNLRSGSVELQGLGKKSDFLIGANMKKSDNYRTPEGEMPNSDSKSMFYDFKLGYEPAQGHRIELSAAYNDVMDDGTPGGKGAAPGYPYYRWRLAPMYEEAYKAHYEGNGNILGFSHFEAGMYARYLYGEMYIDIRPKVNTFSSTVTKSVSFADGPLYVGGKLFGLRSWKGNNSLTLGVDWFRGSQDDVIQNITPFNAQGTQLAPTTRRVASPAEVQSNVGLFAYNDWNPSKQWTLSAGGRLDYFHTNADVVTAYKDRSESTDYPVTGSLGLVYRLNNIIHFTANAGTSFRAPAPGEKFRSVSGYEPNPDLKTEKGKTYEVGMRLWWTRFNTNLALFNSDYDDLIVGQTVDSTIYPGTKALKMLNIGKARIKGLELDAIWLVGNNWKAFMNAAYLHGSNIASAKPLSYIAPFNGLVGMRYTLNNKAFYIEVTDRWSDKKGRIDVLNERETGGYSVLNLYAGLDLNKLSSTFSRMELRFSLDNMLDKAYVSPVTPEDISYNRSLTNPLLEPGCRASISLRSKL